jgi:hypothetical protein
MKRTYLMLLLGLLLWTGCVTTSVVPLNGRQYAPIDPRDVVLYLDEADIPDTYEKVALIYAQGDYSLTDQTQMFEKVRKKAAGLGANGVLIQQVKEPGTGAKVANAVLGTEANRRGEMIAIYVTPKRG